MEMLFPSNEAISILVFKFNYEISMVQVELN